MPNYTPASTEISWLWFPEIREIFMKKQDWLHVNHNWWPSPKISWIQIPKKSNLKWFHLWLTLILVICNVFMYFVLKVWVKYFNFTGQVLMYTISNCSYCWMNKIDTSSQQNNFRNRQTTLIKDFCAWKCY